MNNSVTSLGRLSAGDVCDIRSYTAKKLRDDTVGVVVGLLCLYGSWNTRKQQTPDGDILRILKDLAPPPRPGIRVVVGVIQVDESEASIKLCVGDDDAEDSVGPCPPEELPSIAVATQSPEMGHSVVKFASGIQASQLLCMFRDSSVTAPESWSRSVQNAFDLILSDDGTPPSRIPEAETDDRSINSSLGLSDRDGAVRIFIAGDRSSVGKSSVCLGLLGNLVASGYKPSELAYIKPATQCEAPQLVEIYCKRMGIQCVPVGPVVYYKGFTRAFLAGETESSDQLLSKAGRAVDQLAQGKRLVLIDGVGFPAVGSICGTDNPRVARASGYPKGGSRNPPGVLLVGGSGVGAAVDAFNLNATYFDAQNVPVIGAVFNKLSLEGFYSLENCRKQVTAFFDRTQDIRRPFGFVPLFPDIAGDGAAEHVENFIRIFGEHVDVDSIVKAATRIKISSLEPQKIRRDISNFQEPPIKRMKLDSSHLTREQIENKALQAGAAPSA